MFDVFVILWYNKGEGRRILFLRKKENLKLRVNIILLFKCNFILNYKEIVKLLL